MFLSGETISNVFFSNVSNVFFPTHHAMDIFYTQRSRYLNLIKSNQGLIVITHFRWIFPSNKLRLVLNQSKKCNYDPNLTQFNKIQVVSLHLCVRFEVEYFKILLQSIEMRCVGIPMIFFSLNEYSELSSSKYPLKFLNLLQRFQRLALKCRSCFFFSQCCKVLTMRTIFFFLKDKKINFI